MTTYKAVCRAIGQGSPRSGLRGGIPVLLASSDSRMQWAMPFARTLSRPPSHVTVSSPLASLLAGSLASGVLKAVRAPSASARWIYSHEKACNSPLVGSSSTLRMCYGRKWIAELLVFVFPISVFTAPSPKTKCVQSPAFTPVTPNHLVRFLRVVNLLHPSMRPTCP